MAQKKQRTTRNGRTAKSKRSGEAAGTMRGRESSAVFHEAANDRLQRVIKTFGNMKHGEATSLETSDAEEIATPVNAWSR